MAEIHTNLPEKGIGQGRVRGAWPGGSQQKASWPGQSGACAWRVEGGGHFLLRSPMVTGLVSEFPSLPLGTAGLASWTWMFPITVAHVIFMWWIYVRRHYELWGNKAIVSLFSLLTGHLCEHFLSINFFWDMSSNSSTSGSSDSSLAFRPLIPLLLPHSECWSCSGNQSVSCVLEHLAYKCLEDMSYASFEISSATSIVLSTAKSIIDICWLTG